jgi:adenosylcobinamide-GDP ribazoletransferase
LGFFTAIKFLTIFPIPRYTPKVEKAGESLPYFPLIGLILGGILFGLYYGLSFILPEPVVNALLITVLVIMTGAHHIDGLMDTFDGVVIGKSRERRLAIMSDSKVGTFGIISAILLIMLKYVSLSSVPVILPALLLMPTLSRWTMVAALFFFPYAKETGTGTPFKQGARWYRLVIATIITIAVSYLLLNWQGLVVMGALLLIVSGIAYYFRSLFGGLTGDNYGAINELAEVLVLLLLIIIIRTSYYYAA